MNIVYITLICLIIYYSWTTLNESFLVVGYNDNIVPKYTIKNLFNEETILIDSQFSSVSSDNNFNIKSFKLFNSSISFPFVNRFKILLLEFLKLIPRVNKDKISLGDFNNIYYLDDTSGNRIFILNVNLQDQSVFTSRNIKVKFIVNNIKLFIDLNSNYLLSIDPVQLTKNSSIVSATLDKNGYANFNIPGINDLERFYINNQLYLTDPFITSNNYMTITQNMKQAFDKSLIKHNTQKIDYNSVGSIL